MNYIPLYMIGWLLTSSLWCIHDDITTWRETVITFFWLTVIWWIIFIPISVSFMVEFWGNEVHE